ncbi:MAG: hypothetical protein M0R17_01625 [Candidatus Omnitrophica bacterium]|jgi:co-chaperonin GroES (HSP10)|nr:hypothetical protein [Candidatus Omnitrophota bacterium]
MKALNDYVIIKPKEDLKQESNSIQVITSASNKPKVLSGILVSAGETTSNNFSMGDLAINDTVYYINSNVIEIEDDDEFGKIHIVQAKDLLGFEHKMEGGVK